MRRIAIPVVAAVLALSTLAPAVTAQSETVTIFPCYDGLTFQVAPGQDIRLYCGWGANAKGLIRAFLTSRETTLVLKDQSGTVVWSRGPADTSGDWLPPASSRASDFPPTVCHPDVGWSVFWEYVLDPLPTGTYHLTETDTLRHPVTDGYHQCWYDGERVAAPPSLYFGTFVSTVTIIVG